MPEPDPQPAINPQHLFTFLAEYDDYPVSGQRLAQEARAAQADPDVIQFFEGIPVTMGSQSEVVEHAMKPNEPPYGKVMDLSNSDEHFTQDEATLEISEIKPQ